MASLNPKVIQTEDGSHTLFSTTFEQRYHSLFGALQESIHVFLDAGLRPWLNKDESKEPIHVGEIGFGTGLNAYLTALEANKHQRLHTYVSLEKYPISIQQASQLNYPTLLEDSSSLFHELHDCSWDVEHQLSDYFKLHKMQADLLKASLPANHFHTFFYDAFSPDTQPELWTKDCLKIVYDALRPGGTLVTYCAKGDVKRALKSLGFTLEKRLPGPGKKREMTRATKPTV